MTVKSANHRFRQNEIAELDKLVQDAQDYIMKFLYLTIISLIFCYGCDNTAPKKEKVGGFTEQKGGHTDPAAQKAANLIQEKHPGYQLIKVHKSETQVVAGVNYRFVMEFSTDNGNKMLAVTMFEALDGAAKITEEKEL